MASPFLHIENVSIAFGGVRALNDFSLVLNQEQNIYGIIGPNGAGKSTIFNVITGLYRPHSGQITFCGQVISGLPARIITQQGIARSFQNIRFLPHLSVFENLKVAAAASREGTFWASLFGLPSSRKQVSCIEIQVKQTLEFTNLTEKAYSYPQSLSYGDRKRFEIARALMLKPKLLLLDEPAAGMNPSEKYELLCMIKKISDRKIKMIIIEHDMPFVMNLCDYLSVISQGFLVAQGLPEEIKKNKKVIEVYLGG